jgi:hypothetical protein
VSALDAVVRLLPPPGAPVGAPFDWADVERRLGTALPADYKAYCDRYGHGAIDACWSLSPVTPDCPESFSDLFDTLLRDYLGRDGRPPYPARGGLLAFATSELKATLWWRTGGPPDAWPIVLEDDAGDFTDLGMTATEVLALTLRGDGPLGWDDEDDPELRFLPYAPRVPRPEQVLIGWGETDGEHRVSLDLGGVLGGSRAERLDAFMAWAPWYVRAGIRRVEARGANEVVFLRTGAASPLVRSAAVAFARRELR